MHEPAPPRPEFPPPVLPGGAPAQPGSAAPPAAAPGTGPSAATAEPGPAELGPVEPAPAEPAPLHDAEPRELAPAVVTLWRIEQWLTWTLLGVFAAGARLVATGGGGWRVAAAFAAAGLLLAAVLGARLPRRRYRAWRVHVAEDGLRLAHGVLVRRQSLVPYTRVQHVDTRQGPIERWLGLASVTVHTAAGEDATLTIPGLAPEDADGFRERIARLAGMVEAL